MIERVGDFRNTDFAVQFLMNNIVDFFSRKENWKPSKRPYNCNAATCGSTARRIPS